MTVVGGVTCSRVVELLKAEVAKKGQRGVSRDAGIALLSVQRYIKGIGEPTTATLEKLAAYFNTSVAYLRGEPWATRDGGVDLNGNYGGANYEEADRILGVDHGQHRESQIGYIVIAARMATEEELNSLVKLAQEIIGK